MGEGQTLAVVENCIVWTSLEYPSRCCKHEGGPSVGGGSRGGCAHAPAKQYGVMSAADEHPRAVRLRYKSSAVPLALAALVFFVEVALHTHKYCCLLGSLPNFGGR